MLHGFLEDEFVLGLKEPKHEVGEVIENLVKVFIILLTDFEPVIVLALEQFLHVILYEEPVLVVAGALKQVNVDPHQLLEMPVALVATEAILEFSED